MQAGIASSPSSHRITYAGLILFAFLCLSLLTNNLLPVFKLAGLKLASWDFAVGMLLPWLLVRARSILADIGVKPLLGVIAALAFTSLPDVGLFSQHLRNFSIFLFVIELSRLAGLKPLARIYALAVVLIAAIALPPFLLTWIHQEHIQALGPLYENSELTSQTGEAYIVRFQGLNRDPNYFSLHVMQALALLLISGSRRSLLWNWATVPILSIALVLSGSRTVLLLGVPLLLALLLRELLKRRESIRAAAVLLLGGASLVLATFAFYLSTDQPYTGFVNRVMRLPYSGRVGLWRVLWEGRPFPGIFGNGARSIQRSLEGSYSHNSYFDTYFDFGIAGLGLVLLLFVTMHLRLRRARRQEAGKQLWSLGNALEFAFLLNLMFMIAFTELHQPHLWMLLSLVFSYGLANSVRRDPAPTTNWTGL